MHILQAIKMAAKSLWTNKLRSILTMLGIIIGVTTVSLLTTVAQGVSDAVVSSIRSQSTLAVFMNTSGANTEHDKPITYKVLDEVLKEQQGEKEDDSYFDYSMIYSTTGVAARDFSDFPDDIANALEFSKSYTLDEILANLSKGDLTGFKMISEFMKTRKQRIMPISSNIHAVDSNFMDVYEFEVDGNPISSGDEIMVDREFIDTYLDGISNKDAIGQKITFGIDYHTEFVIKLNSDEAIDEIEEILGTIKNKITIFALSNDGLKPQIHPFNLIGDDSSSYSYDADTKTLTVKVEFFRDASSEAVASSIKLALAKYVSTEDDAVKIQDVHEYSEGRVYTIVGVLKEETANSMFSGTNSTSASSNENSFMSFFASETKGTVYMFLEKENLAPIRAEVSEVEDLVITYAYIRFKTEDVMSNAITNITIGLMTYDNGDDYMYSPMVDFMLISMSSVSSIISNVMDILTTMLTVIAVISLIVGGIGIMNIMLVAVTERTREIGVRKAIGAKRSSILTQFLIEALALSLVGGAIGLIISAIGTAIIAHVIGFAMSMPLWVIGMSLGFCTAIGLIFGMFPAIKAARMQPIDALRRD